MVGGVQFLMFAAKSEHTFTFFSNKFYEFKRNKKARYKKKLVKQIFLLIIFYCMHLTHHGQFNRMSKPTASLTIKLTTLKGQKL